MRGHWKPAAAMMVINFAFALVNALLKKLLDEGTKHMVIITYRLVLSFIFLAPIAYYWERKTRPRLTARVASHLFFGATIGVTATQYSFILGLKYTSSTFSCAFLNTVPVGTFILAIMFRLEKLNLRTKAGSAKVLGSLICMAGAAALTLYKGVPLIRGESRTAAMHTIQPMASDKNMERWILGSILLMGGCLMWSSWFLIQARISKTYPCQYSSTALLTFFAAVQTAILGLTMERNMAVWILKGKLEIISIVYSGIVGSGLCYVGMAWCVKQRGPVFTAALTPFTQIFAAMFDFSVLHEQIYLGSVLGSIVVIFGLYILLWGKSKEAAAAQESVTKKPPEVSEEDGDFDAESQVSTTINSTSTINQH